MVQLRHTDDEGTAKRVEVYGRTAKEARDKAAEVRRRLDASMPARDRKETLGEFTSTWVSATLAASDLKETTRSNYATLARTHIIGAPLGDVTLDRLRPTHVEKWLVDRRAAGLADSTVRSAYTVLRQVLDTAVRDHAIARNPAALVKRPKVEQQEAAYLSPEQVRALLEAAEGSRYRPLFELLVNTGMRRGEALALRWSDVDLEGRSIRVRGTLARIGGELVVTAPKTRKSVRSVHMTDTAERLLRSQRVQQAEERLRAGSVWAAGSAYVFTTETGQPCDPRNALRALKVAADRAGLSGVGLHTLRHSAASVMLTNGVPLKVVSDVLGHSSVAITGDVYGHVAPDVAAQALDALSTALDA